MSESADLDAAGPGSFDTLRTAIHERFDRLSPHLRRIARFALDDPNRFALATVAAIAATTEVQPSSVIRFAQSFGFRGFTDMQRVFQLRLIEGAPDLRESALDQPVNSDAQEPDGAAAVLHRLADANARALERLKSDISEGQLTRAVEMIRTADRICVIGLRRAFPVAAYAFYGLVRSEFRCQLLDVVGGMVPQQVATMGADDLLIAVSFAEYAPLTVDVVKDSHIRGIPTLTITDSELSPLAQNASLAFVVEDRPTHAFRPLAAPMCLVQSLVVAASRRV